MWQNFPQQLYDNIILNNRWQMYLSGLKNTLLLTLGAAVIGIVLGSLVAICKVYIKNKKKITPVDRALDFVCDVYLTIIRGTPMMVQVLIFCWIIFGSASIAMNFYAAMIAFGINSGAYVAEIVRAGINAVNIGQTEAGRSLGLTSAMTMRSIVLPQAIKNILPALANEAITLVKETAIVGYAAQQDITYAAATIRSRTYSPVPLLLIAVVYLLIVMLMTYGVNKLERRLAKSDRG
ncbi:MAG: amino acid ABC transporter permease [Christensenellaceae bacterium]|jgi:His/Glu/Gln/Arg/opine family amino acid ABC transporter permease subunit|nr:amino acid ABC transporter permease [Christensenellaceae bacterium]